MTKILTFGASSSIHSINKKFATWASTMIEDAEIQLIDLNDFEMPLFSVDKEKENGIHEHAQRFKKMINDCDAILISFAEHNGSYSSAYKNLMDWTSRMEGPMFADKPMFLMATSPGVRGGASVLSAANARLPFMGGNIVATFSLPSFYENFSMEEGILNEDLLVSFMEEMAKFLTALQAK